jgi:hypothetical protein
MFCPKCGTKNPDDGKFCRSCGVDLAMVPSAMSGTLQPTDTGSNSVARSGRRDLRRRTDPNEVFADGVKYIVLGFGFLGISMALLFTGVAGGNVWWWAMLFPAVSLFGKGVSDVLKSKGMAPAANTGVISTGARNIAGGSNPIPSLPPTRTDLASPGTKYRTGDLVPASVTDHTTRHLEMDKEGETMTLPKK